MHTTCAPRGAARANSRVVCSATRCARRRGGRAHDSCRSRATNVRDDVMRARHAPPPLGSIVFTVPALQWVRVILAHRVPGETIDMAQDPLLLPETARADEAAPLPERRASRPDEAFPRPRVAAEPDWRRMLGAVRRRRWLVLGVTLPGTAAGMISGRPVLRARSPARARPWVPGPGPR